MTPSATSWGLDSSGLIPAGLPVSDRGFRYGMSVFETIAFYEGRWLFLDDHLSRLRQAAMAARFPFPAELSAPLLETLRSELQGRGNGLLRLYLTAGDGTPTSPSATPRAYALFEECAFPTAEERSRGYMLNLSALPFPSILGGWKTGNYWMHIQAMQEARSNGCQEALLLNAAGAVMSASMANVFFVSDGTIRTPSPLTGARRGTVRSWVIEQCGAEEALLSPEDVAAADECFITNSRIGVMPVAEIDGVRLRERRIGDQLASMYREQILRA